MTVLGIVLSVVHFIIGLHTVFTNWLWTCRKPWKGSYYKQSLSMIRNDAKSWQKLPIHVGIVVVENDISFSDLARISVWCMAFGISYISIYDRAGVCKKKKEDLHWKIKDQQQKLVGNENNKYNVNVYNSRCDTRSDGGCSSSQNVDIILLSEHDGRLSLVNTARQLSQAVACNSYSTADINPSNLTNLLIEQSGFPDPDLILKFGHVNSLLGYLPWQIRLSEILSLPSHRNIDYKSIHLALESYGNCDQRFGK